MLTEDEIRRHKLESYSRTVWSKLRDFGFTENKIKDLMFKYRDTVKTFHQEDKPQPACAHRILWLWSRDEHIGLDLDKFQVFTQ